MTQLYVKDTQINEKLIINNSHCMYISLNICLFNRSEFLAKKHWKNKKCQMYIIIGAQKDRGKSLDSG